MYLGYSGLGDQRSSMKCDLYVVQQTWTEAETRKTNSVNFSRTGTGRDVKRGSGRSEENWGGTDAVIDSKSEDYLFSQRKHIFIFFFFFSDCDILSGLDFSMLAFNYEDFERFCRRCKYSALSWMTEWGLLLKWPKLTFCLILFAENCWPVVPEWTWRVIFCGQSEPPPATLLEPRAVSKRWMLRLSWWISESVLDRSTVGFQDATPVCQLLLKKIGSIISVLCFHHLWIKPSKLMSWDLQRTINKQATNWFLITKVTKTMTTTSSGLEVPISPFCFRRHSWVWYVKTREKWGPSFVVVWVWWWVSVDVLSQVLYLCTAPEL